MTEILCVHCGGRLGRPGPHQALGHIDRGFARHCGEFTAKVATFCAACWDYLLVGEGGTCDACGPRCVGDGRRGAGCGWRGGYSGSTCEECGGMVLDGLAIAEAAAAAARMEAEMNRPPVAP